MDIFELFNTGPLAVVLGLIIMVLLISYIASRYRVANANEALIISGSKGNKVRNERGEIVGTSQSDKGIKVVVGGGTIVLPLVNKVGKLKLTARQIQITLEDAVTKQGVAVKVQGVATFKIGRDVEHIRNAAERFLDTPPEALDDIVKNVLEGSLRSIVGTLTIEDLISSRQKLLAQVQEAAIADLETSGLEIDAFTIQSVNDHSDYIKNLGEQNVARVQRDAAIVRAQSDQEAAVARAKAQEITINADMEVALRKADADQKTQAATARAAQAAPLATAEARREVTIKETDLALLEAERKEKELLSTIVRPAEAEAEAQVRRADGERRARIAMAEAEARGTELAGLADAAAVQARGEAEASAMEMRAEAFQQYNQAAVLQTVLAQMPAIVSAAAEPMSNIGQLTVLSSDGASDVVRQGTDALVQASTALKGVTGIDLPAILSDSFGKVQSSNAKPKEQRNRRDFGAEIGERSAAAFAPAASTNAGEPTSLAKVREQVAAEGKAAREMIQQDIEDAASSVREAPEITLESSKVEEASEEEENTLSDAAMAEVVRRMPTKFRDFLDDSVRPWLAENPRYRETTLGALMETGPGPVKAALRSANLPAQASQITLGQVMDHLDNE